MVTKLPLLYSALLVACMFLWISCDEEDAEEIACAQYFISEQKTATTSIMVYYNSDGLISAITSAHGGATPARGDYVYDSDKRLKQVKYAHADHVDFVYDKADRLIASLQFDGDTRLDSVVYEYNDSGLLIKRSDYGGSNAFPFVEYYVTMEYPNEGTVIVEGYSRESRNEEFINIHVSEYTIDDKKLPFPDEYYTHYLSMGNSIFPHNVLSTKTYHDGVLTYSPTFEYTYNRDGYPLSQTGGNQPVTYTYACEPVVE